MNKMPLKRIINKFLLLFVPVAIFCLYGAFLLYQYDVTTAMDKVHSSERATARETIGVLEHELETVLSDLFYFASQLELIELVSDENRLGYKYLESDWKIFSRTKKYYDQIRLINSDGQELLRIDFNDGQPISLSKTALQNKSTRYYFTDTFNLNRGEVFTSPLDLNMERGEIEKPLKPIIRLGTPVFDHDGKKQGVVIINYLGNRLLNKVTHVKSHEGSKQWLLNSEGYWLKGSIREQEWGFMLQQPKLTLANQHPKVWNKIKASSDGQFMDEEGLWTFSTAYPFISTQKSNEHRFYFWKVVLHTPYDEHFAYASQAKLKFSIVTLVILCGFFIACWWVAKYWAEVRNVNEGLEEEIRQRTNELFEEKKQAEVLANTDELTGMNNRRAFFEHCNNIYEPLRRYGHTYSIIMLDLDLFKNINDTYGHHAGDITLQEVSKMILKIIRTSDIAGRLGGEEFAILLPETSSVSAKDLAERIRSSIADTSLQVNNDTFYITASFGVSENVNGNVLIDDVLAQADRALYQAKESGRNKVEVLLE